MRFSTGLTATEGRIVENDNPRWNTSKREKVF